MHLNQPLDLGAKVDIQLNFKNSTTHFKCTGVVVRSKKENEKFYNTGIEFDALSDLKNAFLLGQVAELIELEQKGKE